MAFLQDPPRLDNQFDADRVLRSYLARASRRTCADASSSLARARWASSRAGRSTACSSRTGCNEPTLKQWDAWGSRIDHIEVTPLWQEARRHRREMGLVGHRLRAAARRARRASTSRR